MYRPSPATGTPTAASDGKLTLRLLGEPVLERIAGDGTRQRVLGMGKPLALIAYLAVVPQHEASRDFLADLLWGDDSVSDPLHNLRNAILLIAKQVDAGLLESTPSRCRLAIALPTDVACLSVALGEHDLERAMAIYVGEFLPDFAAPGCREFEHWCESIRLRVRTDVANAADVLVRQLLDAGRPRDAERHARRMIDIEPHNQRGRRILLEALIASGDRMAALTEAALTEQWLAKEGYEPEAATTAVLQQARRTRAPARPSEKGEPASDAEPLEATSDLVGRAEEFAAIMKTWDSARAGRTSVVSIVADAGLGKTRLLGDIENRLRAQRAQVVSVGALMDEREVPFAFVAALAGALARLPGAAGVSPATGGILVGLDASLGTVIHADADFATSDTVLRRARALQDLLASVAEERSVALLLDDLHWADDASLAVLPAMLARLTTSRALVVTASRPGRGVVLASERTTQLGLAPLTLEHIGQLIASIRPLPSSEWSNTLVRGVFDTSRGVPIFALLALRDTTARQLVRIGDATWECDDPSALERGLRDGTALPHATRDLSPRARQVLLRLAVAGRSVPAEMLGDTTTGEPAFMLVEVLYALERRALIHRVGTVVAPAHDVVAEAALADAPPDARHAAARHMALRMLAADDPQWHERGVRLFATVASAHEIAPRLAPFVRAATLPPGVALSRSLGTWIGRDSTDHVRLAVDVARALPLSLRLRPFHRHLLGAGLAIAACAAALMWRAGHPAAAVDATLVAVAVHGDSTVELLSAPLTVVGWDAAQALEGRGLRASNWSRAGEPKVYEWSRLFQRTGEQVVSRIFEDSSGSDIVVIDARGTPTRLTASAGDDLPTGWSPDGRFIAIETSRWSSRLHHRIGILDRVTGAVRQVSRSDGLDGGGIWSPDGSRIAWTRRHLDGRPDEHCIADIDGGHERCNANSVPSGQLFGWRTPTVFLAQGPNAVSSVEPDSAWRVTVVAENVRAATASPNGRWLAWFDGRDRSGIVLVAPSHEMDQARRLLWQHEDVRPSRLQWGPGGLPAPYIERLRIASPTDTVFVGIPHRLSVVATWSDSSQSSPPNVRWRIKNPSTALIDAAGTLTATSPGPVTVSVTAGGWRSTSRRFTAVAAVTRLIAAEDWSQGFAAWRPFGDPLPTVTSDTRLGRALLNNGDGSYDSGAYSRATYAWSRGFAVDAVLSTPVTELQWQTLVFTVRPADGEEALARWNHRSGYQPAVARGDHPSCLFFYPAGEGINALASYLPNGAVIDTQSKAPLRLANGRPFRVRLQVFPDGHCGLAINGAAVLVSDAPFNQGTALRLATYGKSWKSRMLVGPLTIWEGVPPDIDWTRIRRGIPPDMPPSPAPSLTKAGRGTPLPAARR